MRIDSHQHFWQLRDRLPQDWPPASLAAIHRDFGPADLEPLLARAGMHATILVQSLDREDETDRLLALADGHDFIAGVVGWIDLKAGNAVERIAERARHRAFKSVRPMLQDIADIDWIADPALRPAVDALIAHEIRFDALITPRHLEPLRDFAERHPLLPIVIDHGAKPEVARGTFTDWRKGMDRLARLPNTWCKLSGLLTEAGDQRPQAIRPYAETILDLFGPSRTMWGSDWPVLDLAGEYQAWLDQCLAIVPEADHDAVFGRTAAAFYRIEATA